MHTSNTRETQQVVLIYLYLCIHVTIMIKEKPKEKRERGGGSDLGGVRGRSWVDGEYDQITLYEILK